MQRGRHNRLEASSECAAMRLPVALAALVLVAVPLAGCFNKDTTPPAYTLAAASGKVSQGWDYAGTETSGGDATLAGHVSNADNTGAIFANFSFHGGKYEVIFDQFKEAEGKTFQDGGVAFGLTEHGDSGTADAAIPKIHAKVAAYGLATLMRDGKPVVGKAGNLWAAHLMVYDDAIRGPDGKITKADGAAPYDPSSPADAKTYPGTSQAMLKLVSPDGETATRAPVHVDKNVSLQGPQATGSVDIPLEPGAEGFSITVNSTTLAAQAPGGAPPLGVGTIAVTITVGGKTYTDQGNIAPNTPYSHKFDIKAEDLGNATAAKVDISGSGAYNVQVIADIPYDDHPFIVVTWDNPTLS